MHVLFQQLVFDFCTICVKLYFNMSREMLKDGLTDYTNYANLFPKMLQFIANETLKQPTNLLTIFS